MQNLPIQAFWVTVLQGPTKMESINLPSLDKRLPASPFITRVWLWSAGARCDTAVPLSTALYLLLFSLLTSLQMTPIALSRPQYARSPGPSGHMVTSLAWFVPADSLERSFCWLESDALSQLEMSLGSAPSPLPHEHHSLAGRAENFCRPPYGERSSVTFFFFF